MSWLIVITSCVMLCRDMTPLGSQVLGGTLDNTDNACSIVHITNFKLRFLGGFMGYVDYVPSAEFSLIQMSQVHSQQLYN